MWDVNAGRLLVVHAPNLVKVWSLNGGGAVTLQHSLRVSAGKSAVTIATMVPRSGGITLFGTVSLGVTACDASAGMASVWSFDASGPESGADKGGALCALELRPDDAKLRLLVGVQAGALRVLKLSTSGAEAGRPLILRAHPRESVPLCCATWLVDSADDLGGSLIGGGSGHVAAGYANGDVHTFSLRRPEAPLLVLQLAAALGPSRGIASADADAAAEDAAFPRRSVRWLHSIGGGSSAGAGGAAGAPPSTPILLASGGTSLAIEPDGLVVLRGANFQERSLLAPPRGGVLVAAATCAAHSTSVLPNGTPTHPESLHVLSTSGDLYTYSLRTVGAAPRRYADGVWVEACEHGKPRVRLAITHCGGRRCLAHLSVATPLAHDALLPPVTPAPTSHVAGSVESDLAAATAAAAALAYGMLEEAGDLPRASPFYDPAREWPGRADAAGGGLLGGAARWLQQDGSADGGTPASGGDGASASSSFGLAGKWLGDGLNWASREVAKHQEAARAAPLDALRTLLFPPPAVDVSDASHRHVPTSVGSHSGAPSEEAQRAALFNTSGAIKPGMTTQERVAARRAAYKAAKAEGGKEGAAIAGAASAQNSLHQSLEAMHERGQKLNELGDKSAQLADDAEDFANMAKQCARWLFEPVMPTPTPSVLPSHAHDRMQPMRRLRKQSEKGIFGAFF